MIFHPFFHGFQISAILRSLRFSLDTESGFKDVVFVTSAYGLGETVVGGTVNPDEWRLGWWMDGGGMSDMLDLLSEIMKSWISMDFSNFDAI